MANATRNGGRCLGSSSPTTTPDVERGNRFPEWFNEADGETFFKQFDKNPHELSFLAVHDFRKLHMKNIYYYQMELRDYPAQVVNPKITAVSRLRVLLAENSISDLSLIL